MTTESIHDAIDDLAALLSEMTAGDLSRTTGPAEDLGDTYLRLLRSALGAAATPGPTVPGRTELGAAADLHGGGYDRAYRQAARAAARSLDMDPVAAERFRRETLAARRAIADALGLGG